jgi:hypothetical protein
LENFRTATFVYVVGREDISYAVTLLAHYYSAPDQCRYLALKRLCKYLRRTIDWEIPYWRQEPCDLLPATDLFETICQIRGDELDEANTHELVHHIHGTATPDEQVLGSFTRRKLKQLPICDLWLASEIETARPSPAAEDF